MISWLKRSWRDLARILTILGIGILVIIFYNVLLANKSQSQTNTELLHRQQKILDNLAQGNISRDKAVEYIIDHQDQQTLILCTLIIANGTNLNNADAPQVESICKEKIQSAQSPQPSPVPAPVNTKSQAKTNVAGSSSNTPPKKATSPVVKPGVGQRVNNFVKSIANKIDGFTK